MRAMHLILKGLCYSDCLVYLDDIIIFGRTLQGHRERLSLVMSASQKQAWSYSTGAQRQVVVGDVPQLATRKG